MESTEYKIYDHLNNIKQKINRILTIGTVESATGGRIADKITNVSGISDYFKGSVVSYSNEIKCRLIGVDEDTLSKKGAVSSETAIFMAEGGKKLLNVDVCVSDTGIAGPTGDTSGKPIGIFYLGLYADDSVTFEKHLFNRDREGNKKSAVESTLALLERYLANILTGNALDVKNVVTCFLRHNNKIMIVKRSQKVGTYQGFWSGISGYMEKEPLDQAYTEIQEETSLGIRDIKLVRKGVPFELVDEKLNRKWIIHPFLFDTASPKKINIDWENIEKRWIDPKDIRDFETVPGLDHALNNVIEY
jgi:nicotinamide-nucleotide amidase